MATTDTESRTIWTHAKIYGLGSILHRAAGLVLIPIYAHLLDPIDFGIYAIAIVTAEFATVVLSTALGTAMVRCYIETGDDEQRAELASSTLVGFVIVGAFIAMLSAPLSAIASDLMFGTARWRNVFHLALVGSILSFLLELELNYYRIRKRPWVFLVVSATKSSLVVGLNLLLVAVLGQGIQGVVLANSLAFALTGIPVFIYLMCELGAHCQGWAIRRVVALSLPLIPAKLADISTGFFDRFFLNLHLGSMVVGHYALAQRLASLLHSFVISPFAQIWIVRRLETLDPDSDQRVFKNIFNYFLALLVGAALALAVFSHETIALVSSDAYQSAERLVPLICLAFALMPIDMNFQLGILYASQTRLMMWASLGAALVNLAAMYLLVPRFGAMGAAVGMTITNVARIPMTYYMGARYCASRVSFDARTALSLIALAVCIYLLSFYLFRFESGWVVIIVKSLLLAGYAVAAYRFAVDRDARATFQRYVRSRLRRLRAAS